MLARHFVQSLYPFSQRLVPDIDWTGNGIHVDGLASGNILLSLDGGPFSPVPVNQTGLVDYRPSTFGNHSLVVNKVPGGNLTVTEYFLLDIGGNRYDSSNAFSFESCTE